VVRRLLNQASHEEEAMTRTCVLAAGAAAILIGCGGGDDGGPDGGGVPDGGAEVDATPGPDGSGPPPGDPRGEIRVTESRHPWGSASAVQARFYQTREARFHRQTMAEGDCVLFEFEQAFCDPPCNGICVETNVCEPWPVAVSAGTLTIDGLTVPVTIEPDDYGGYWNATTLPENLFDEGATITATLSGAELAGFTLETVGTRPLAAAITNDEITLENGSDFTLTWTPGGGGRVLLTLNANNNGHGAPYNAIIRCDAPDEDGAITVPASIIGAFPETYRWEICAGQDCPLSTIARYRRDEVEVPNGYVKLVVSNETLFWVIHEAAP
jgi:hypothetical protein